jgi:hypothetical protein
MDIFLHAELLQVVINYTHWIYGGFYHIISGLRFLGRLNLIKYYLRDIDE